MKILHILLTIILLFIILFESMGMVWENEVLFESSQPKNINYGNYSYSLRIIKMKQLLGSQNIVIVSHAIDPNYGHVVYYLDSDILSKKLIQVKWSKEGVSVSNEFGTKIMILKKSFIGLR